MAGIALPTFSGPFLTAECMGAIKPLVSGYLFEPVTEAIPSKSVNPKPSKLVEEKKRFSPELINPPRLTNPYPIVFFLHSGPRLYNLFQRRCPILSLVDQGLGAFKVPSNLVKANQCPLGILLSMVAVHSL